MIYVFCVILLPLTVQSLLVEELESLFSSKHCIEASIDSLSLAQNEGGVMLDSANSIHTQTLKNTSLIFDKTATSRINELAQYNDIQYIYKLTSEEGASHAKTYTVNLLLGDESYEGTGPSLKKAQQVAAVSALENTFYEHPPQKIKEDKTLTPTVALNNIATKLGIAVSYYLLTGKEEEMIEGYGSSDETFRLKNYPKWNSSSDPFRVPSEEPHISGPFTVRVRVGDLRFEGVGHTIQGARHDAAFKAIKAMEEKALLQDSVCKDESLEECKRKRENLKSPVSRVYEAAQIRNLPIEFNVVSESGKPHKKVFVTQCKLGDYVTEGEGSSKKESKRVAAEKMLENLTQLKSFYDENVIINTFGKKKKKKRKKKNKVLRSDNNFVQTVSSMVSSVWSGNDDTKSTNNRKSGPVSAKDKLLEIAHGLNVAIDFTDLNMHDVNFFSLLSLGVRPPYICLGKAATRDKSHENAAYHGIKLLYKVGLFGKDEFSQYYSSDEYDTDYELGHEAVVISLENSEKDKE